MMLTNLSRRWEERLRTKTTLRRNQRLPQLLRRVNSPELLTLRNHSMLLRKEMPQSLKRENDEINSIFNLISLL